MMIFQKTNVACLNNICFLDSGKLQYQSLLYHYSLILYVPHLSLPVIDSLKADFIVKKFADLLHRRKLQEVRTVDHLERFICCLTLDTVRSQHDFYRQQEFSEISDNFMHRKELLKKPILKKTMTEEKI